MTNSRSDVSLPLSAALGARSDGWNLMLCPVCRGRGVEEWLAVIHGAAFRGYGPNAGRVIVTASCAAGHPVTIELMAGRGAVYARAGGDLTLYLQEENDDAA